MEEGLTMFKKKVIFILVLVLVTGLFGTVLANEM